MTELMEFFRETGSQGGKKRAKNLTPAKRKEIAAKAAAARWGTKKATKKAAKKAAKKTKGKRGGKHGEEARRG